MSSSSAPDREEEPLSAWLVGIILDLLLLGSFFDVALRDFGLSLAALALGRLSAVYDGGPLLKSGAS